MKRQSWSIIIFGHNEEETISGVVRSAMGLVSRISGKGGEVIVVDDGSTDGTPKILRSLGRRYPNLKIIRHEINRGIGPAMLSGYSAATGENCCAVPADGQFDLEELVPLSVIPAKTFVSFYRERKDGYSMYRHLLSLANRRANSLCFGMQLRDVNWVKVFKTAALGELQLKLSSSLVTSEICAKLLNGRWRAVEVPSRYLPRTAGVAKGGSANTLLAAATELVRLARSLPRGKPAQ